MTTPKPSDLLTLREVAEVLGVTPQSAATYHADATKARRDGVATAKHIPEPDRVFGRSPSWKRSTITKWAAARPGRGKRAK